MREWKGGRGKKENIDVTETHPLVASCNRGSNLQPTCVPWTGYQTHNPSMQDQHSNHLETLAKDLFSQTTWNLL